MNPIETREIVFGSDDYQAELELRYRILRQPLGLEFTKEELARENEGTHVGAFLQGRLVGCLYLVVAGDRIIRMRQVAVASDCQGQGIGRAMVSFAESYARSRGFQKMILTARQAALPFYRALGYQATSDVIIEVTIPHQKMEKSLS